jgi:hypothetical protein
MTAKSIGEALAAIGVIASLIFVAWEVRQNSEEIRQNTIQSRATAYQAIGLASASAHNDLAHDRSIIENVFMKAPAEMNRADWWQFSALMSGLARVCETLLHQIREGALPESAMDDLGCYGWRTVLDDPKTACVWLPMREWVGTAFREFVEEEGDPERFDCSGYPVSQTPFGPS